MKNNMHPIRYILQTALGWSKMPAQNLTNNRKERQTMNTECIHYRDAFPNMVQIPEDRHPATSIADAELNGTDQNGAPIRRTWIIHRLVWTIKNGPIPRGYTVRHTCGNKHCINPAHLELGKPGQTGKMPVNNLATLTQFLSSLN